MRHITHEQVTKLLLDGESTVTAGKMLGIPQNHVHRMAKEAGLVFNQTRGGSSKFGQWVQGDDMTHDIAPEVVANGVQRVVNNEITVAGLAREWKVGYTFVHSRVREAGYIWQGANQYNGGYVKKDQDEPAQLPIDEYEALLAPEPITTPADVEPASDIQREIEDMRALVEQATAFCNGLRSQRDASQKYIDELLAKVQELKQEIAVLQPKAERYDEDQHRLNLQKIETSRRLLRQSGDDLRSAMAVGS